MMLIAPPENGVPKTARACSWFGVPGGPRQAVGRVGRLAAGAGYSFYPTSSFYGSSSSSSSSSTGSSSSSCSSSSSSCSSSDCFFYVKFHSRKNKK